MTVKFMPINLQIFADGGEGGATANMGETSVDATQTIAEADNGNNQVATDKSTKEGKVSFDDLIKGDYKEDYSNQAYQNNLSQLNNVIPELYNAAYNKFQNEGNDMMNKYGMLNDLEQKEYSKYTDKLNQYNNDVSNTYNIYDNERKLEYQQEQDKIALQAAAVAKASAASSKSSSSSKTSSSSKKLSQSVFDKAMKAVDTEGSWEGAGLLALDKYIEQLELKGYSEVDIQNVFDYAVANRKTISGKAARAKYNKR